LQLYLLTAQVAYQCHCFGQAEACINAIIDLIGDMATNVANVLHDFLPQFVSFLLVVPDTGDDQTEMNMVALMKRTLGAATQIASISSPQEQLMIGNLYIKAIHLLAAASGPRYPYNIGIYQRARCLGLLQVHYYSHYSTAGVQSNDVLWYGDDRLVQGLDNLCSDLVGLVIKRMEYFSDHEMQSTRCQLTVTLYSCVSTRCRDCQTVPWMTHLWAQIQKDKPTADRKTLQLIQHLEETTKRLQLL
jgi:hypothetical protein